MEKAEAFLKCSTAGQPFLKNFPAEGGVGQCVEGSGVEVAVLYGLFSKHAATDSKDKMIVLLLVRATSFNRNQAP